MKKTGACKMAGDSGTYEVVSRYLKDAEEQGSALGGGSVEEAGDEEEEEEENAGVEGGAAASSSGHGSPAASAYEVIDGTLYRKRLERGATSYTEVLVGAAAEQRRAVIASFHQQPAAGQRHCTMEETYKNVSENYWWEGMFPDIRDYVQGCNQCKDRRDNLLISEEKHITRKLTTHCTKVLERLNSQRSKGLFCDVTLIVEKTSYPAHRAVLAAVSEYFQDLFSEKGSTSNKIVDLKGFSSKSFLPLLEFSYTSSLSVKPDCFAETSALARHLRIWEVVEMCAALCKLHGTANSRAHKEEASKEEKKEFSSYEVCIDQSLIGPRQHVPDIYYRFGQLEDGSAQQKLDNFGRNVFSPRSHSPVIQGETKVPDFTFKLQEMQSGLFKDKLAPVHSESSIGNLGVETLENPSRRFKLLGFYDKTPSKTQKVKSASPQRCSSANKVSNIPTSLELKFADKSRNVYHQRKCNLEKTPVKSKSHTRVSKHLDHNIAGPQDNSGCKGVNTLLRSPVRQMATEEELYSPNATEKYKLLSVLGLQRKTSITDGEEQASWKQKRRLRQPKVRNYSLLTGTRKRKIDCAKSQLQQDQIKAKGLTDCFVVIEKILPPIQKQKGDNQQLNKALFALKKSEPLNCKINLSQGYTGKEVCSATKIQISNPKTKTEGCLLDKKIQQRNKFNSSGNSSLSKKSQCQTNSSISKQGVKDDKLSIISLEEVAVSSKTQTSGRSGTEGSPLTRQTRSCASCGMSVKCSSSLGSTAAKMSPCLTDHGHSGRRRTRQSYKSIINCRKCKLKNLDYMPSCSQNAAQKHMSKRTLLKNKLSLEGCNFHENQKLFFDDICVAVPSKSKGKQVLNMNLLNQLPAKAGEANVGKLKGEYDGKSRVPNVCQNSSAVGKEQKAATQLDRRPVRNEQTNSSRFRCKQETKKQEQLKTVSKEPEKQIPITSNETRQVKRKVKSTGCRSLDAENHNYLHSIKTPVLGKRKRIPTQKIIEAGFSFGFLVSSQRTDKINRLPVQTRSKQFNLSPSLMIKNNHETESKMHVKVNSKVTTSNEQTAARRQTCNTTEPSFGQRKLTCSEVSERMKENVAAKIKRMKPVVLYGKKLLNLNIKNTLGKKGTKPNAKANTIKKDTQLSTSQKAIKLQEVASASSKITGSKSLPKNLRGAAQVLKKMQPKFKEVLKLTPRGKYIAEESVKKTKVSRAHTCHECSATFTNCDSLFMHRMRHTRGKRWPCLLCDKSFYRLKKVQVHLRSHSEKLYRCKLCVTVSKKVK
ncbi:uncharacterized protein si:dkey-229b18.3 [Pristis pectinata]|uniref:uncharacterized protein si:dkey-229b18.3 n=1 Tax=Pristis pectinata TaxID=685728 RepID=UPI00223D3CE7|nr:uncharacterized protein si:dkey-229b18.3 [Pristis pectinata]